MTKLKHWTSILLVTVVTVMIVGCANNPLGMSDDEWAQLNSEQQFEARKIQDARDEAARERRAKEKAQQAAEQAQLVDLRRNAPFGDVVQCTITNADGYFAKEWHAVQEVSIEMHSSEAARRVDLLQQDRQNVSIELQMGFDGLNVKLCNRNNRDCDVLAGTDAQFRRGISRQIRVHKVVEGTLFCSFPQRR